MVKEFKKFAVKGNVLDMAIGVIIGGAFGKIVASLVSDIIMPLLTLITGKIKFENLFIALDGGTYETIEKAQEAGVSTINYGIFITAIIDFFIIALYIFFFITQMANIQKKLAKKHEEAPPAPTVKDCPFCKTSIHIDAIRCPNCTSELETEKNKEDNTDKAEIEEDEKVAEST